MLTLQRLGISGLVAFLVDTGADNTIVHPLDARHLRVVHERDFDESDRFSSTGIGGSSDHYAETCDLHFTHDDGRVERVPVLVRFAIPGQANAILPSILGRDVIGRYRLTFEQASGLVALDAVG